MYSAGNGGPKICGVFSESAPLQRSSTPFVEGSRGKLHMSIIVFTMCSDEGSAL